jgi:hypothetical protein
MGLSAYLRAAFLEASVGRAPTLVLPDTLYLALLTQLPSAADTGSTIVEPGYAQYSRTLLAGTAWDPAQPDGSIRNSSVIPLPAPTAGDYQAIAWALCDAAVAGNVHWFGQMPPILLSPTDPSPQIDAHAILVTLS